ncbi:MAG: hypothetical protein H6737_24735 [Alphaproteobacteria bacterium]|nr:hypothetical protein [Alphaproteobacteria bacterium]
MNREHRSPETETETAAVTAPETRRETVTPSNAALAEEAAAHDVAAEPSYLSGLDESVDTAALTTEGPAADAPAVEVDPVTAATERMRELAEQRESARAEGDDDLYADAIRAESAALAETLASLPPDQRVAFLESAGAETITQLLGAAQGTYDMEMLGPVVEMLASSSEGLDAESLALVSGAVGRGATEQVGYALIRAMEEGHGATLAVDLATTRDLNPAMGVHFGFAVDATMAQGTGEFQRAAEAANLLRAEVAAGVARMQELGLPESEIRAWETQYLADHQQILDTYEQRAEWYAGTLDARELAHERMGEHAEGSYSFDEVGLLAGSEVGGRVAAEAVMSASEGEPTWLDHVPAEERERWVSRGAMEGVAALASAHDVEGIDTLLAGLQNLSPDNAEAVQAIRDRLAGIDPQADSQTLQQAISDAFAVADEEGGGLSFRLGAAAGVGLAAGATGVAAEFTGDPSLGRLGNAFGRLGAGLSAIGRLSPDELGRFEENLGLHIGIDAASFVSTFLRRGGAAVGAAIGVLEAALYASEGNYEAAGIALLPVIGAGIGSLFGPLGTVIGGFAGSAIGALLSALGVGSPDQVQRITTPLVIDALTQRGWPASLAEEHARLFASEDFGPQFQAAAEALGYEPTELMTALGSAPPEYVSRFLLDLQMSTRMRRDENGEAHVEVNDFLERMYGVVTPEAAADAAEDDEWRYMLNRREQEVIDENRQRMFGN